MGVLKELAKDVGLREEALDFLRSPRLRRYALNEEHDLLELHSLKLLGPHQQKRSADVDVKGIETILLGEACVPEPHDALQPQLAHQQAIHPAERELNEEHVFLFEVL